MGDGAAGDHFVVMIQVTSWRASASLTGGLASFIAGMNTAPQAPEPP